MGGNLFKLGRIPQAKYLKIEAELRHYLDTKLGKYYRIPRYYATKPDFGDLDIVVSQKVINQNWLKFRQEIVEDLGITQYKSDGHVFSTIYQNFQVDYFLAVEDFFESTYNYLSFNDLGNLIGKICRKFNLKYGEKGLTYVYRRQLGNYKKDLLITTNFQKICDFLELNYSQWQQGFETLEDIFVWAIASPYFSVQPYFRQAKTLEKRAKNRTTIQKFIEYLENQKITKTYEYLDNRNDYISLIDRFFPEAKLLEKLTQEKEAEEKAKILSEKFNGKLIKQLIPTLSDRELGEFIVNFKKQFDDFEQFILESSSETIKEKILFFYH